MDSNTSQDTRKEQEQEHENEGPGYSPYGGEQKETGPVINGIGELAVMPVEHGNEPCRYCQLHKTVSESSGHPKWHCARLDDAEEDEESEGNCEIC